MLLRAIIVDDEQPSVDKMARLLKESGIVDIKGKFTDPIEALKYMENTSIDVAFLDIEMPEMSGIELANFILELNENVAIVFITAYNEYAVEAFRINAIDYLMKPLDRDHLKETLNRIMEKMNVQIYPQQAKIYCFDRFKVITEQGEVKFRTAKAEELMAFFIDRRGAEIPRSEITDRIWSEFDGDRAVTNFNSTLYYMKKALLNNGAEIPVERVRDRYRLNIDKVDCDYYKFISFVSTLKDINESTISRCEEAADLYKGDYFKGNEFSWVERNRIYVKEKYISLIINMVDYYESIGHYNEIIKILEKGLKQEPLHNGINYRLINTFILMEDKLSAVKYYNIYKKRLKREFGMEPNYLIKKLIKKVK